MDALELPVNGAGQREGIEPLAVPVELSDDLRAQVGSGEHPLEGRARGAGAGPFSTRIACLRWCPVTAQNSSRIRYLSERAACR